MYEDKATGHAPATVAVVGLGKIGLPLATCYAMHGWHVTGCDINAEIVEQVNAGQSHVQEEPELAVEVPRLVSQGLLMATSDTAQAVRQSSVVVVIVPVMVDERHQIKFDAIDAASAAIGAGLQPGTLVIYETTLPVGTTALRLRRILEQTSNLQAGPDFLLAYSPERVSSGRIFHDLQVYPKVVGGIDEASTRAAETFYRSVLEADIIAMPSTNDAEFVKLVETTYRDVNIALANEFAQYADMHGLDVMAAIAAANTQPYSHVHTPGVGVGGHCIPVYPYFLINGLLEREMQQDSAQLAHLLLPRAARQVNDTMAEYAVQRLEAITGSLASQAVLIMGVSYRGDVRETAFSSGRFLRQALLRHGARVFADDPLYSNDELRAMGYTPLSPDGQSEISAIIVQAAHSAYYDTDFSKFSGCQALLDGRMMLSREKVEQQGIRYIAIGDGGQAGMAEQEEEMFALNFATHNTARLDQPWLGGKA
ncbi:MAG TPA: nucleotide sugar dehydrogenase [Ktedonobacteraceae bacterium]|nr:nucleotide sugar dehydrogenase [Ktedonobacteraceae bacterium]